MIASLFLVVGISLFGGAHMVSAQDLGTSDPTTGESSSAVGTAAKTAAAIFSGATFVNTVLSALTYILNYIVIALGKITILLIEIIIIPILNYNSFSSSPIIGLGWSLVRDVMNMFVIVALIAIAVLTIVGNHKAHWEQQLPQLLIAVVLMNFSRTICGLFIDVSQVIMFTFVNALLDIASGNFIQLFQLQDFGKLNPVTITASIVDGNGFDPFRQFIEAFLQIPLYGSIVAILFLLALAFLYRIVLLWILVILSPMAFFMGGIKGIFHGAEKSAGDWWGKFTGALMMGPILTFFLWLALAAASSGSMATAEHFDAATAGDTTFFVAALDSSHVTSLLLALILLTVGMQIAGEQASKVGGAAASLINEGMGKKVVGGALRMSTAPMRYAATEGAARANIALAPTGSKSLMEGVGKKIVGAGAAVGGVPLLGAGLASMGGAAETYGASVRKGREEAAVKAFAGQSESQKMATVDMMEKNPGRSSVEDQKAVQKSYLDDKFRKDREKHLVDGGMNPDVAKKNVEDKFISTLSGDLEKVDTLPEAEQTKVYGMASKNIAKIYNSGPKGEEMAKKLIAGDKFVTSKLYDQAEAFDEVKNPGVAKLIKGKPTDKMKRNKDGEIIGAYTQGELAATGQYGQKVKDMVNPTVAPTVRQQAHFEELKTQGSDAGAFKEAFDKEKISVADVKAGDFAGDRGNQLTQALVSAKVNVDNLGAGSFDPSVATNPVRQEFVKNVVSQQKAQVITSALSSGKVTLAEVKESDFTGATTAQKFELTRGIVGADDTLKEEYMDPQVRDAFATSVSEMGSLGVLGQEDVAVAQGMLLRAGKPVEEVLPTIHLSPVALPSSSQDLSRLGQLVKNDAGTARHFAPAVPADLAAPNEITKVISENIKPAQLKKLVEQILSAKDDQMKAQSRASLETIAKAVEVQHAAAQRQAYLPGAGNATKRQRLNDLHDQLSETMHTVRSL